MTRLKILRTLSLDRLLGITVMMEVFLVHASGATASFWNRHAAGLCAQLGVTLRQPPLMQWEWGNPQFWPSGSFQGPCPLDQFFFLSAAFPLLQFLPIHFAIHTEPSSFPSLSSQLPRPLRAACHRYVLSHCLLTDTPNSCHG